MAPLKHPIKHILLPPLKNPSCAFLIAVIAFEVIASMFEPHVTAEVMLAGPLGASVSHLGPSTIVPQETWRKSQGGRRLKKLFIVKWKRCVHISLLC